MTQDSAAGSTPQLRSWQARPHWSYSQLAQFLRCPLQYYFERIIRLPRPFTPSSMALGSAIHVGLAAYHRTLMTDQEPDAGAIKDALLDAWDASEDERPIQYRDGECAGDLLDQGVTLLEAYLAEPPPQRILAVEEPLIAPLYTRQGEYLEKPLVAIVDLLSRDDNDGLTVTEFKTSSRRYSDFEADMTMQATCYVHAVQQRYEKSASVRYTVLVKTKKPAIQRLETVRTAAELSRLGDIVQSVERAIDAQVFYPVENPLNCSGCPYRLPCRDWSGNPGAELLQVTDLSEGAVC